MSNLMNTESHGILSRISWLRRADQYYLWSIPIKIMGLQTGSQWDLPLRLRPCLLGVLVLVLVLMGILGYVADTYT